MSLGSTEWFTRQMVAEPRHSRVEDHFRLGFKRKDA